MQNRRYAVRLLLFLLCAASFMRSERVLAESVGILDPEEAETWNTVWAEYSAFPIDIRYAPISELTIFPDVDDSLAERLRVASFDRVPESLRDYVRSDASYSANLRTRISVREPHTTASYSDAATYTRISGALDERWSGGVLVERDAEEPRLADHTAWTLAYRRNDGALSAVGGQIGAHIGTGLIVGRSGLMWIDPASIRMQRAGIRPSLASVESGSLTGGAIHVQKHGIDVLVIIARPRWDAVLNDSGVVKTIRKDGIHITEGQRAARDQLRERFEAARLGFTSSFGTSVGITAAASTYNHPIMTGSPRAPERTTVKTLGIDGRIEKTAGILGGEIVRQGDGRVAASGLVRYRIDSVELIGAGWSYEEDTFLPHGNGFSFRDDASGERAALFGIRSRNLGAKVEAWTARYYQTYANASDPFPRSGWIENIAFDVDITSNVSLSARARHRGTMRPGTGEMKSRSEIRFTPAFSTIRATIRPRFDYIRASPSGTGSLLGLYGATGIRNILSLIHISEPTRPY